MLAPTWIDTLVHESHKPTKEQVIKWVIMLDRELPAGLQLNAVACLSAAVGKAAPAMVGTGGIDASGSPHAGLPWTGCTVLAATAAIVKTVRATALTEPDLLVADMASVAQRSRVYDDYLAGLARLQDDDLTYYAVSIAGPRPRVDRLTGRFPLLR
ncbi:DUF2000 domain-containing protein [Actinomadura rudentiformis]|uniref:DUF2000 domain-containing protein n=2 Tax=Actinomadura rudentiformis TaxID=359158 RepID=A0A6H9YMM6_9ACTN|nr:DUF2000 domain-containing protein [Actinomadura rudentiformis]